MSEPRTKKRKFQFKKKFYQPNNKHYLEVGHKGFLATCNFNAKDCVRECYNILNEHADELYGVENSGDNVNEEYDGKTNDDIADELQKQISCTQMKIKSTVKRRFQVVDTGAANCIFIKTTLDCPKALAERIVHDIAEKKLQKTRHLLRLLPIEAVCKANHKDIVNTAGQLCDKYFLKDPTTFSIVFNKRYNNDIDRQTLIHEIWELIHTKNVNNIVDLKNAKRSLIIEVIKGLCCVTVVDNYITMKKYNLVELSKVNSDHNKEENETKTQNMEKDEKGNIPEEKVSNATNEEEKSI